MIKDPKTILAEAPMNAFQIMAVVMCILLNALDGFDVLAISFAAPGIVDEWGINRAELGVVLSMELIGMSVGSILLGGLADRYGRRPAVLTCLVVMATGMYLASMADSVNTLLVVRFATGLGIGGMLASVAAMVAEYSNARVKNLAVMLMAGGYPMGAVLGGSVASALLVNYDWRAVFIFGAIVTGAFLFFAWFLMPESIEYLAHKRPPGALERINHTLKRMGHPILEALPERVEDKNASQGFAKLFSPGLIRITVVLTAAYFAHIMTFYYIVKWIPKIVVDLGYTAAQAGGVLVWANVGGSLGAVLLGLINTRFNLRNLTIGVLLMSFVAVILFGVKQDGLWALTVVSVIAGFFTLCGIVGLYALFAQSFPADVRASGTGFAIGVGRGGSALGPMLAGFLFAGGLGLFNVSLIMAFGALLGAVLLTQLRKT